MRRLGVQEKEKEEVEGDSSKGDSMGQWQCARVRVREVFVQRGQREQRREPPTPTRNDFIRQLRWTLNITSLPRRKARAKDTQHRKILPEEQRSTPEQKNPQFPQ